ncbi:MAG: hypothetical protein DRG11_01540 [Epsilonproteobacteria bacterium]|nr:MAG: hypothetical protein DRG11_01540 [Campylobacterota bacterium]
MIRYILILLSLVVFSFAADTQSVFGAGDISSPAPFGLNDTQKQVIKNKKTIKNLVIDMNYIKNDINKLQDNIDGISSVIEDNSNRLNDPNKKNQKEKNSLLIQENKNSINDIRNVLQNVLDEQAKIQTDQSQILQQLKLLNSNKTRKTEQPVKDNVAKVNVSKDNKPIDTTVDNDKTKKSKVVLFKEAKKLYKKEYYTKAIPIFENLVAQKYKPAESTYHLGHMWYVRKKYSKALSYFKQSATMHDKGWWMPKLLLYSAISFEKTDDLDNAANFYSSLIEIYPNTKEAKIAKKNIGE